MNLKYTPAGADQYDCLFDLISRSAPDFLSRVMEFMDMTENELRKLFRSVGEVYAVYEKEDCADFFRVEKRNEILHLHALILDRGFRLGYPTNRIGGSQEI